MQGDILVGENPRFTDLGDTPPLPNPPQAEAASWRNRWVAAGSLVRLDGYTVLDGDGNLATDASVTRQHVIGLPFEIVTPEPGTWALMLSALGMLAMYFRRNKKA